MTGPPPPGPVYPDPQQTILLPRPDPTVLTNEAVARASDELRREITAVRDILDMQITGRAAAVEARLDAMDKALAIQQETIIEKMPLRIDSRVMALRQLLEAQYAERFNAIQLQFGGIQTQFTERDTRAEQTSRDSKVAVDAALQAAKEAVAQQNTANNTAIAKSETATTKQIDQLGTLVQSATAALNDKIDDLKGRLTAMEGKATGVQTTTTTQQTNNSYTVAVVGLVIGSLIAVGSLLLNLLR